MADPAQRAHPGKTTKATTVMTIRITPRSPGSTVRQTGLAQEIAPTRPESGHDADEDDQRDAVADAAAVICSPSHIRNIVPPTSVTTQRRRKRGPD